MYCTGPTTGKTMWSGTFGAAAPAVPTAKPRIAARKRTPRAVVRWRLMRERALRFASEGQEGSSSFGLSRVRDAMKIAVCVKQVPEGNRRLDPDSKRLD